MKRNKNKGVKVLAALGYLILFVVLFVVYVRYLEKTSVFFPATDLYATPKEAGLSYEDVYFKTEDGFTLHGWLIKVADPKAATILYFHGNAGNIADRIEKISLLHRAGVNVFIIDYRGFGLSDGKPSEAGLYKDALAAFDHLAKRTDIDTKKIIAYGTSIGGAAASDLATKRPLAGVIMDSCFTKASDMSKLIYPFIPSFLLSLKLDNEARVSSISVPKLFIHSEDDETVPLALGKRLYESAAEPKEFVAVRGGHNEGHLVRSDLYLSGLKNFLNSL